MHPSGGIAAILLAAGASARLGRPKQLLEDAGGEPLVRRAAQQLLATGAAPVLVVLGAHGEAVASALHGLPVVFVANARHADGMGTSIAAGVQALLAEGMAAPVSAVLIAACDMPAVDAAHLSALIAPSEGGARRVASSYPDGVREGVVRGIPALFPRSDWGALSELGGDTGARALLRHEETLTVFIRDGNFDLDTPADVARWQRGLDVAPP